MDTSFATAKLEANAQKKSLVRQPNDDENLSNYYSSMQKRLESKESESDNNHVVKIKTHSQHSTNCATPSDHIQKKSDITDSKLKTPQTPNSSRLQKIASIRDKLSLITIDENFDNGLTPEFVSPSIITTAALMVRTLTTVLVTYFCIITYN